ncbi:MAG: immunity 63 family protein [Treponema sp.]|jgi:hypothetical protein|nr:immunity 63 family protein [Treponema sp.]
MNKNKFLSTSELERHITCLWSEIAAEATVDGVSAWLDLTFTAGNREGGCCYSDDGGYHYRYFERGKSSQEESTCDLIEIAFIALYPSVHLLASTYECKHRIKGHDFRRLFFEKILHYFAILGEEYRKQAEAEINKVLEKYPYRDKKDGHP